ncbi:Beta-propeller domains of methanol dehydrogenase type, partial [hydrothermal vent metagenome]
MRKIITSILITTLVLSGVFAQGIPDKPNPPRLVNDFASVLSKKEVNNLENALEAFARETSTQIVIVTVNSIEGDISDFAFKLGEKWGVGQKKDNNGVVIVLKPKRGNERGQVFVATGYGIEHLIPDAIANRDIVDNEM